MLSELAAVAYDVLEVVIPLVVVSLAAREQRPPVAIAWLAFALLLPILALGAYLYLAHARRRRDVREHRRVRAAVRDRIPRSARTQPAETSPIERTLAALLDDSGAPLGGRPALDGNQLQLLQDDFIDALVGDIERAQQSVHLLFYLYNDDATGRRLASALRDASRRGVACRLLVGAYAGLLEGSRSIFRGLSRELEREGVCVVSLRGFDPLRDGIARIDLRNHRKIAVIDGWTAYTGSQNIHDPDLHLDAGCWHQMMVRVEGPAAVDLEMPFLEDWLLETGELLDPPPLAREPGGDARAQAIWWGPSDDTPGFVVALHTLLQQSSRRVVLTTPYFVPDEPLATALALAARRGVRVDLIVPSRSDKRWVDAAARRFFGDLLAAGVAIHLHEPGLLHAKSISADDEVALVGSANLDHRSLYLDYEAALLVYDAGFARRVREAQEGYLAASQRVCPDAWGLRPGWRSTLDAVAALASPLL